MKLITILFGLIFLIKLVLLISLKNKQEPSNKENFEDLPQKQLGILSKVPDGPVNEEEIPEEGDPVAVVTFSDSVKNKKIGKMRITGKNVNMLYPTDTNNTYVKKLKEMEDFEEENETNLLDDQKKIVSDSHKNFENEFHTIYEKQKDNFDEKSRKNLLNLQIEKEQEIYNKMVQNELDEVRDRSFNGGFITPLLSYNLKNTKKFFRT